jgi:hypothetical protein
MPRLAVSESIFINKNNKIHGIIHFLSERLFLLPVILFCAINGAAGKMRLPCHW